MTVLSSSLEHNAGLFYPRETMAIGFRVTTSTFFQTDTPPGSFKSP
jgi:hypothetical protein